MNAPNQPIETAVVVVGSFVGLLATWFTSFVVFYTPSLHIADDSFLSTVVGVASVPVLSALLLVPRRTRYAGAGMMIGFAIGSITGAGICGALALTF